MIKFWNIRNKEIREAETEPQIAALWASSDHSPNITQGQDFGWRLAPEVVVEMKRIKQDYPTLLEIGKQLQKNADELGEIDILHYISMTNDRLQQKVAKDEDYTDSYDAEVRRLEKQQPVLADTPLTSSAPVESIEDLTKRVELEERLAKARATATDQSSTVGVAAIGTESDQPPSTSPAKKVK